MATREELGIDIDWEWGAWWDKMDGPGYEMLNYILSDSFEFYDSEVKDPLFQFIDDGLKILVEINISKFDIFSRMRLGERLERFVKEEIEILTDGY